MEEQDLKTLEKQFTQCEKWKNDLLEFSPIVTFLVSELDKAGCKFDISKHFKCAPCVATNSGAFVPDKGVPSL